jgi:hypothetical protein
MLDVLIADLMEPIESPSATNIVELEKAGKLAASTRLQISTIDENPAHFQTGGRPLTRSISGGRGGPPGQQSSAGFGAGVATTQQLTSVQLQATTLIEKEGTVIMQIYVERPDTAVPRQLITAEGGDESRRTFAFVCQSTLRVKSGVPKVLGARQSVAGNERSQTWIVVTASVPADSK